jgi:hypothetical protein
MYPPRLIYRAKGDFVGGKKTVAEVGGGVSLCPTIDLFFNDNNL